MSPLERFCRSGEADWTASKFVGLMLSTRTFVTSADVNVLLTMSVVTTRSS